MTTTNFNKEQLISVPIASETEKWLVERATDAEVVAWTDTTRYITPKQVKDNYWMFDIINISRDTSISTSTVTYNHSLWKIPKSIKITSIWNLGSFTSDGWYANNKNYSTYSYYTYSWGAVLNFWQSTNSSINHQSNTWSGQFWVSGVIQNLTSTTFDIVWTKIWSSTWTCYATLIIN